MRVGKDGVSGRALVCAFSRCPGGVAAQNSAMRIFMSWLGALVLAVAVQAQDFTRTMTADERAAAGLEKLSAEELAKLKAYVERYKSGAVAVVQEQAEQKVAATEAKVKEAEQKAVVAEEKAKVAETKIANAAAAEKKSGPSWFRALVTLQETSEKPAAAEAIVSRLVGDYDGWTGRTLFRLENGQIWQQAGGSERVDDTRHSPEVKVYPGMLGSYWLEIEGVRERVKVKPIKLK